MSQDASDGYKRGYYRFQGDNFDTLVIEIGAYHEAQAEIARLERAIDGSVQNTVEYRAEWEIAREKIAQLEQELAEARRETGEELEPIEPYTFTHHATTLELSMHRWGEFLLFAEKISAQLSEISQQLKASK